MLWVKAFHIIALISWFAGLFYMPRLFVYHAQTEDQLGKDRFIVMERKLFRAIMMPAAIVTIALGLVLWLWYDIGGYWLYVKLGLVALLVVYQYYCWRFIVIFREDRNEKPHTFYRFFNELPTLLLIGIVLLVVLKPF